MRGAELDHRPKYESIGLEALRELHAHGAPKILTAANVAAEISSSRITLAEMSTLEVIVKCLEEGAQTRAGRAGQTVSQARPDTVAVGSEIRLGLPWGVIHVHRTTGTVVIVAVESECADAERAGLVLRVHADHARTQIVAAPRRIVNLTVRISEADTRFPGLRQRAVHTDL